MNVEVWAIDRPVPYKANARRISKQAVDKVAASLQEFGWRQPIVVDEQGVVIAGHTRLKAAKKLGLADVPVHVAAGLSPEQVRAYRLADNRAHDETGWNRKLLAVEVGELQALSVDLATTAFDALEIEDLLAKSGTVAGGSDDGDNRDDGDDKPGSAAASAGPGLEKHTRYRPSWNKKRTVRYLSLRKWRADKHDAALRWFKDQKKECSTEILDAAASEFVDALKQFIGPYTGQWTVTNPPTSKPGRTHFATQLGKFVAAKLGIEYVPIFEDRPRSRPSHPGHHAERGELKLAGDLGDRSFLLVDDISTSGNTIEQCTAAIDAAGRPRLAMVWIYGDVNSTPSEPE